MSRTLARLAVLVALLLIAACRGRSPAATAPSAEPAPTIAATLPAAPATTVPQATTTDPPTVAMPSPAATEPTSLGPFPAPALFVDDWDVRSDFAPGLVASAQGVLDELPLATVYHMDVRIDQSLALLEGMQELRYANAEDVALEELYFRLYPNLMGGAIAVEELLVNGVPVTPGYELAASALRVPLPVPLQPGEQVVLRLEFTVTVPQGEGGGHYGTFILDEEILALAHFYPIVAVYDDEGWNLEIPPEGGDMVYSDSAFYRVRVTAPAGLTLAASGVAISSESDGRQQEVTYVAGPMRDFYLVASERFGRTSQTVGETELHSYTYPGLMAAGEYVLETAAAALKTYERYFGPYPFTELDLASTPTLALGVEYPGIVVNALRMYDPSNRTYTPVMLESTTAHEVAHQWFYSTVGNDQLDEPWIDEALAQFSTMLYFEDAYGAEGRNGYRESLLGRWQRVDLEPVPVGMPVAAYSGAEYGAIVYGRGPLFFEALEEEIGAEAFAQFLRDFYETHTWGIATTESLQATAEAACDCDLEALFAEWIYAEDS
ncbi:MAG: M1 family metallopeptidase [Anaerolineae bacterium]|nr:M1 family metallopeptidase [Anaerolineae bacterium]